MKSIKEVLFICLFLVLSTQFNFSDGATSQKLYKIKSGEKLDTMNPNIFDVGDMSVAQCSVREICILPKLS